MHPIEHLRYVARSGSVGGHALVGETAYALASLGAGRADLLISCRRILARHPAAGPLWAACARLVVSSDPARLAWDLVDRAPVDVDAVALHLPSGAALVTPAEWLAAAFVAAAGQRTPGADAGERSIVDEALGVADLHAADDDADVETPPAPIAVVDDGMGPADLRALARLGVDVVVSDLAELGSSPVVFEPTLVAVGTLLAPASVAATVARAAAAGHAVWAAVVDDEVLPAAFGSEASNRIADLGSTSIDPAMLAGVVGASGRRRFDELVATVPYAPELLRAPV